MASLQLQICRLKYSRIYSSKSPVSDVSNISEPWSMSQVGRVRELCAHRSVCFCSQSGGGAGIGLLT